MTAPEILECVILDADLKKHYPQGVLHLPRSKALDMETRGLVSIGTPGKKPVVMSNADSTQAAAQTPVENKLESYLTRTGFSRRCSFHTRVAYIQDNSKVGGAELSNLRVVQVGQELGFDIVGVTPSHFTNGLLDECDVAILNNFFEFPVEITRSILRTLIEHGIPYVKYDHDYRELKRTTLAQVIFGNAAISVFISPRHQERMLASMKSERIREKSVCLPLAIDTEKYKNIGVARRPGSVLIPCWRKGKENIAAYINANLGNDYTFIGACDRSFAKASTKHISPATPEQMPAIYNQFETVLHLPDTDWAGERIYFEAQLCGCKFIGNEYVGHLSWTDSKRAETIGISKQVVEELRLAPYKFWREVEEKCLL